MAKSNGGRPAFRVSGKNKETKQFCDFGAAWESDRIPGCYNLKLGGREIKEVKIRVVYEDGRVEMLSNDTHFFNVEKPRAPKNVEMSDAAGDDDSDF